MGVKRTRSHGESDDRIELSAPPGFSLPSFTLKKAENSEKALSSVVATSTIISTRKLKSSVKRRPWILDDHVVHKEEVSEFEAEKSSSSNAYLPKGVIRGCSSCHNCQKVLARWRPELARVPSLEEAPVFHPTEEEFKDTLKYVASILPQVKMYGVCRIIPPSSWKSPCRIKEETTEYGVETHIQRISDLQLLAHKKTKNKQKKILSGDSNLGHNMELKEFGLDSGPKFTLKSFKSYADHFKGQYFIKKDQTTESSFRSDVKLVLSEPSILDIEGEYWRIIENPTEEIEVLQGNNKETRETQSRFPLKFDSRDVTYCPHYVESGWNLNNTPKLKDSLLRFESSDSSSILLPRLSIGMCFSSNIWRIEEHHLYLLSYMHFGAQKIFYGVPGSYRYKFEEAVKKQLPQLSAHPGLLHNLATQFSPSTLTSEGIPVYRCVQKPKEFVLILPGAYHAEFDSGFNCSEAVNFAPVDWLPHGQTAVELYCQWGRKTSISHDRLLFQAAAEAIRVLGELSVLNTNSFDNLKWRAVCQSNGILAKALKSRVTSEARRRKYLCASLELQKMEDEFCTTTKWECPICFYDLYLSAIGCKCSPHKYTCLLHAKQLCACAWSEKYLLIRNQIDELNIMVEALEGKLSAVHRWAKENARAENEVSLNLWPRPKEDAHDESGVLLNHWSRPKEDAHDESEVLLNHWPRPKENALDEKEVLLNLWSHSKENAREESEISLNHWSRPKENAEDEKEVSLNLWSHSQDNIPDEIEVSSPKLPQHSRAGENKVASSSAAFKVEVSSPKLPQHAMVGENKVASSSAAFNVEVSSPKLPQHATVGGNNVVSSSAALKKRIAREPSSSQRTVIILSDDEN